MFFLPFLLHNIAFSFYPAINTFVLSFKEDFSLLSNKYSAIGFGNYENIFSDKYFIQSIENTFIYASCAVPISVILSVLIALFLNKKLKGTALFQTAFFLPLVTASTAVAFTWRLLFNGQYGLFNAVLDAFDLQTVAWLTSPDYSMLVLIVCGVWSLLPFSILTILSSLQAIDITYYKAASIDGASKFKTFRCVTLPFISNNILLLAILNSISSFRIFDELFALFSGKPGPTYNLYTLVYYMYEQMQTYSTGSYGKAAAAAMILFAMLLSLSIIAYFLRMSLHRTKGGHTPYEKEH